ncbi:DnaB-like helicase N-terminal domain-containing protein [Rhodococcus sp. UNC363MFTsu5.1]|uniref:DnaB-like helicase N-terminal domain-containing protein n=1 Tax=Rhodococcus sp. UNC363MFTsu5.1 TaxID=1449069 RepID=UPI0009DF20B1|nr:DnaB-like helicase N-terminal domain-containing protein [Rhodococcus sp. UNC363MFTsu5.1]
MSTDALGAVGQPSQTEMLFLGALLISSPKPVAAVLNSVDDDDIEDWAIREILGTARTLHAAGRPCDAVTIEAELRRLGGVTADRAAKRSKRLMDAVTSGASDLALLEYASAVVAEAYRRRYRALAAGLAGFAETQPETELLPYLVLAGKQCRSHSERLARLRGESPTIPSSVAQEAS